MHLGRRLRTNSHVTCDQSPETEQSRFPLLTGHSSMDVFLCLLKLDMYLKYYGFKQLYSSRRRCCSDSTFWAPATPVTQRILKPPATRKWPQNLSKEVKSRWSKPNPDSSPLFPQIPPGLAPVHPNAFRPPSTSTPSVHLKGRTGRDPRLSTSAASRSAPELCRRGKTAMDPE